MNARLGLTSARPPQSSDHPVSRQTNMVNIWLGPLRGAELADSALREAALTGHATTKTSLGRELLLWAFGLYQSCGSLACLKSSRLVSISPRQDEAMQDEAFSNLERIFQKAPTSDVEIVCKTIGRLVQHRKSAR